MMIFLSMFGHSYFGLYVIGVLFLRAKELQPLRWLFGFCAIADTFLLLCHDRQTYFDAYWLFQCIELTWSAWIAGDLVSILSGESRMSKALHVPWLVAAIASLARLNFPFFLRATAAEMRQFQNGVLAITLICLVAGALLTVARKYRAVVLAVAALPAAGLIANLAWSISGRYWPDSWGIAWSIALGGLLLAARGKRWSFDTEQARAAGCSASTM